MFSLELIELLLIILAALFVGAVSLPAIVLYFVWHAKIE
ncbi:hypothetical protein MNBD_CHLOROFLEXI01-1593 [hydrothermal vent metagenome]|uniref:Uncharacterized protein n=1 Tax=hydrothermal vent metagenome TaxID=652676 RepID=A0A3B0V9H4_9ZZZZ